MKKCCFNCKECYCVEPKYFIHVCNKRKCNIEPNHSACQDYKVKDDYKDKVED